MAATMVQLAFALCLIVAAMEDGWRLRISNIFPMLLIALFVVAAGLQDFRLDWGDHVMAMGLVFAVGLFMFARGWLGGGDVKLWTAMSLWFGLEQLMLFTLAVVLSGGLLAVTLAVVRKSIPLPTDGHARAPLLQRRGPIPYGVALCAGGLFMLGDLLPL